jgi:hypothetical protein
MDPAQFDTNNTISLNINLTLNFKVDIPVSQNSVAVFTSLFCLTSQLFCSPDAGQSVSPPQLLLL